MPVVRRDREVSQAPIPGVRKTAAETALSRGAGLEQAKANRAETIAGVGGLVTRIGAQKYAEIQREERDKADQIAALAMGNAFAKWEATTLYDPDNGAMTKQGKDALPLPEQTTEAFTKISMELEETYGTNDRARRTFQTIKAERQQRFNLTIRRHVFEQMQAYGREELAGTEANAHNAAVANALDPDAVAIELDRGVTAIKTVGPKLGLGPEAIKKRVGALTSRTVDDVTTRLLANGFDRQAKVYLEESREAGLIPDGDILARIEQKVKASTTDANGERAAAEIWASLGPTSDREAISIDKMETAARARFSEDTDSLKATISALRSRQQGVAAGRREREDVMNSTIWGAVAEGRSLQEIRRLPEFINAPGEVRTRIGDYFDNEAARVESRAASRESRASAAESRAAQADFRHERELELKGWSNYLELSDPAKLRDMTRGDILKRLPELGQAHVNRLLNDQEKITKDDATFRAAVIDRDLFNDIINEAGVPGVYPAGGKARTPTEKANLGKLQAVIEDDIARKQVAAGRRLSREETEAVARATVDRKVMVKDKSWWYDESSIAALVNATDAAKAYVPFDQIPKADLAKTYTQLRAIVPALSTLNDAQLRTMFGTAIEKAYGAYVMGLGDKEITKRLLEGGQ